ncbi:hypothetical protein BGX26_010350, partial [Mortierella sp. AD094]
DGHYPWLELPKDASGSLQQASSNGGRAGRKRQAEGDGDADKETGGKRTKATTKNKAATVKQLATTPKGKANAMQVDS